MSQLSKEDAYYLLFDAPVIIGQQYGFDKLVEIHNKWIVEMVMGEEDGTLQGHRGSYKTTCLSVALACLIVGMPWLKILFMRKTDTDVKEIVSQVKKILLSPTMQAIAFAIYGHAIELTKDSAVELSTNLCGDDPRGTSQLVAMGIGASITGKHFDRIFTDDIVNVLDRTSKAEREKTKIAYDELQNIKNRGGRIFNTGTPWHKEDCFVKMPPAKKYDCYSTGLMTDEEIQFLKERMVRSLFCANYELKHISDEDVIFASPQTGADPSLAEQGKCHIDASYGGEDSSVFTICNKKDGKYYVYGRMWHKHIDDCEDEIIRLRKAFNAGRISCEDNGDKGYLAKDLRKKGERTHLYHENMNKYLKITSYLKAEWKDVIFVLGTDPEYIQQIEDYNENAEHDDAPDSLASIIRELWSKKERTNEDAHYSMYM